MNIYEYAAGNPLIYVDPEGNFLLVPVLWGAGVGILTDITFQLIANGGRFHCINVKQVVVAAGIGAIGGGVGGYVAKLRQVRQTYHDALISASKADLTPYQAWITRRIIGEGLKKETPLGARQWIYGRNLKRYNDELGPAWERVQHKTTEQILFGTNPSMNKLLSLPSRGLPTTGGVMSGVGAFAKGDCLC